MGVKQLSCQFYLQRNTLQPLLLSPRLKVCFLPGSCRDDSTPDTKPKYSAQPLFQLEINQHLSIPQQSVLTDHLKSPLQEEIFHQQGGLNIQSLDCQRLSLLLQCAVEKPSDPLALKIRVNVKTIDMAGRFEFDEAGDTLVVDGHKRFFYCQACFPKGVIDRGWSSGFLLCQGLNRRIDSMDGTMEEISYFSSTVS